MATAVPSRCASRGAMSRPHYRLPKQDDCRIRLPADTFGDRQAGIRLIATQDRIVHHDDLVGPAGHALLGQRFHTGTQQGAHHRRTQATARAQKLGDHRCQPPVLRRLSEDQYSACHQNSPSVSII